MSSSKIMFGDNIVELLGPYTKPVEDVHSEVCGGGGDPSESFIDFLNHLGSGDRSPLQRLATIISGGGQNKEVVASTYRRFLEDGRKCPKGSHGLSRWTELKTLSSLDPGKLSMQSTDFFDAYVAGIRSITNPEALLRAWEDYIGAMIESTRSVAPGIEKLIQRQSGGEEILGMDVQDALFPLLNAFDASKAFLGRTAGPIAGSWEYHFVQTQSAKLSNFMSGVSTYLEFFFAGMNTNGALAKISRNLATLAEPFNHIHYSFAIDRKAMERVSIEAPGHELQISPAYPVHTRKIIDEIVYEAGKVEGAKLKVEWNEERRTISFIDLSDGESSLQAFADPSGGSAARISALAEGMDAGQMLKFVKDEATGRINGIEIAAPRVGSFTKANAAVDSSEAASAKTQQKKLGGIIRSEPIGTTNDMSAELLKRSPALRELWNRLSEAQKERALASLILCAKNFGVNGVMSLGDGVFRTAFESAAVWAVMPGGSTSSVGK